MVEATVLPGDVGGHFKGRGLMDAGRGQGWGGSLVLAAKSCCVSQEGSQHVEQG